MSRHTESNQFSVRVSQERAHRYHLEIEKRGMQRADLIREKLELADKYIELREVVSSLLNQIRSDVFVITSSVAGLDPDEADQAKASIEKKLNRRLK